MATKLKINTTPLEWQEQETFVDYLTILEIQGRIRKFTAIPNSTYTTSWAQKIKNKKQGLRAGLLDIFILTKNDSLWIEMKRTKGGVISPEQQDWADAINASGGNAYFARGFAEAKEILNKFL